MNNIKLNKIIYGTKDALNSRKLNIEDRVLQAMMSIKSSTYELYESFMVMSIEMPSNCEERDLIIAISKDYLCVVVSKEQCLSDWLAKISNKNIDNNIFAFSMLLDSLIENDNQILENIELEISDLEDDIAENLNINYNEKISGIRKRLLGLKRYYENLYDILDVFIDEDILKTDEERHFKHILNKTDRLSKDVVNLREYITQVREAYQSQTDISLNKTMKLFTVITAVFSPLTLLVGWYGMNFNMPELKWQYGYLFVIMLAIIIVVLSVFYFRKKKWF